MARTATASKPSSVATATANGGSYRLVLRLNRSANLEVGRRGTVTLPPGLYVYVGSARRNLAQRVARHQRLARTKEGRRHWHVDALLLHPDSELVVAELHPGAEECPLLQATLRLAGSSVPVPGFGATDCRAGCPAHLVAFPTAALAHFAARPPGDLAGNGRGGSL